MNKWAFCFVVSALLSGGTMATMLVVLNGDQMIRHPLDAAVDFSKCGLDALKGIESELTRNIQTYSNYPKLIEKQNPNPTIEDLRTVQLMANRKATLALVRIELASRNKK